MRGGGASRCLQFLLRLCWSVVSHTNHNVIKRHVNLDFVKFFAFASFVVFSSVIHLSVFMSFNFLGVVFFFSFNLFQGLATNAYHSMIQVHVQSEKL